MCLQCAKPKTTTMSSIFEEVRQMLGEGLIYVMPPCGIGCTIEEAFSVYGKHQIFSNYRLEKTPTCVNVLLMKKDKTFGTFFKLWKAV